MAENDAGLWVFASTSWYVSPVHQVSLAGRLPHPADDPVTIVNAVGQADAAGESVGDDDAAQPVV